MPFKTSFLSTIILFCPQLNHVPISPLYLWACSNRGMILGATCTEKVLYVLFNTSAMCVQLVLVRLWSLTDYGGLEMDLKRRIVREEKEREREPLRCS